MAANGEGKREHRGNQVKLALEIGCQGVKSKEMSENVDGGALNRLGIYCEM